MKLSNRFLSALLLAAAAFFITGCGAKVEVPPAHVGKISTKDGYQENLIPTSKFRLDYCWAYCDRLILVDVSDKAYLENLSIFIPEDKLNLEVAVRTTLSVNPAKTTELFNAIAPKEIKDSDGDVDKNTSIITSEQIYATYASQIIQAEVREYLSKNSMSEIASSNEKINADLRTQLSKAIEARTPFQVRYAGITNFKYPKIITDAQESAAERREAIQKEEAQLAISKAQLERELQEARLTRAIEKEKAETEALAQTVLSASIDSKVLEFRRLEIELEKTKRWDGKLPVYQMGGTTPIMFSMPVGSAK